MSILTLKIIQEPEDHIIEASELTDKGIEIVEGAISQLQIELEARKQELKEEENDKQV